LIATELENAGLKPIDPPTVIGTTHKLDYDDEPIPENYSDDPDPDHWTPLTDHQPPDESLASDETRATRPFRGRTDKPQSLTVKEPQCSTRK
jgi:hypothetical protein